MRLRTEPKPESPRLGLLPHLKFVGIREERKHGANRPSAAFATDAPSTLTQSGPYRWVRHPFYGRVCARVRRRRGVHRPWMAVAHSGGDVGALSRRGPSGRNRHSRQPPGAGIQELSEPRRRVRATVERAAARHRGRLNQGRALEESPMKNIVSRRSFRPGIGATMGKPAGANIHRIRAPARPR